MFSPVIAVWVLLDRAWLFVRLMLALVHLVPVHLVWSHFPSAPIALQKLIPVLWLLELRSLDFRGSASRLINACWQFYGDWLVGLLFWWFAWLNKFTSVASVFFFFIYVLLEVLTEVVLFLVWVLFIVEYNCDDGFHWIHWLESTCSIQRVSCTRFCE